MTLGLLVCTRGRVRHWAPSPRDRLPGAGPCERTRELLTSLACSCSGAAVHVLGARVRALPRFPCRIP